MKSLYIPTIGDSFTLAEDWTFTLHDEYRNTDMRSIIEGEAFQQLVLRHNWKDVQVTLPKGSVLKVDRIYIRKGVGDYDSITFWLTDCPNKAWAPKKAGGTAAGRGRFWVKLADANNILFE